ncbi:MAG: NifU family protein, partial [Acidimicrobiales bacterium]
MPDDAELRAAGDRIAALLESLSTSAEPKVWARIEEVLGLVTELYGEALGRVMVMAPPDLAAALAEDDLVASLLIVHGLHPDGLRKRVERALEEVRPALGSHGGDVSLVDVDESSGEVVLQMLGSCD